MQGVQAPASRILVGDLEQLFVVLQRAGELSPADPGDRHEKRDGQFRDADGAAVGIAEPVADGGAQVEAQWARQPIHARLRNDAEDLPVGEIGEDFRNPRHVEALFTGAEETEDRSHRAAGDEGRLQTRGFQEREGGEVDVASAAAATADEHQVAVANLAVERLQGKAVAERGHHFVARGPRRVGRRSRRGEQLVGRGDLQALRIEQRPQQLHEPLAQGTQQARDGDVAAIRRAYVDGAGEGKRVPDGGLVAFVEAAAGSDGGARELGLHLDERADLGEPLGDEGHAAPRTRKNAARTPVVWRE